MDAHGGGSPADVPLQASKRVHPRQVDEWDLAEVDMNDADVEWHSLRGFIEDGARCEVEISPHHQGRILPVDVDRRRRIQ